MANIKMTGIQAEASYFLQTEEQSVLIKELLLVKSEQDKRMKKASGSFGRESAMDFFKLTQKYKQIVCEQLGLDYPG